MKNILILCAVMSCMAVACGSEETKQTVDYEDAAEVLYVLQNEVNRLSLADTNRTSYLVYADADHQTRIDYAAEDNPEAVVYSHVFYKHKWHFALALADGMPSVIFLSLTDYRFYNRQSEYVLRVLRELNNGFRCLKENGEDKAFYSDYIAFSLEKAGKGMRLDIKRYAPEGREIAGAFTEEKQLRRKLAACEKEISVLQDSVAFYERQATEQRTFLRNAELCAEYRKRRREYNRYRKMVFSIYDQRPYDKIKQIVESHPQIVADEALYTSKNLQEAKVKAECAEKCADAWIDRLTKTKDVADSMRLLILRLCE